ncbi:glycoside hydrolase family 3 C-terminal domain-containing protein [Mycobacterium sp. PSTR-4-N]|uniref:glycoside hydrolase family 3 C-terminal domain-containing protein n=1 Tax=Mycobacterium sp. PSTR-4-N TaxID=2917745 RepID=UPI001F153058|nr:glycoside hydrolase family 3 C-terminal domain-containing protein [Mycobacterium sp. PSTR-4-N]MCG7594307.1 glycoside hydrolase family 3 C-terminal domain-containing protein [Mycobacterium sp. PSTR-4-N]
MDTSTSDLPLHVKASLGSGASFWQTKTVAGLQAITLTDGPHGVRVQHATADHLGLGASSPATCFPPAAGLAQSWDRDLVRRVAAAIADEARALGVSVVLGPGVNIKRDPRCGRNFEYYSEDPLLSGSLGAAWVDGLQARGVGASVKHFAANNTETDRMRSDSQVDARALREIYLKSFEIVVTQTQPWTVMCSYNKINGVHASENKWLLTDVLRGEWGFDGLVVSDWGAVADRVAALAAGLDLAMPGGDATMDDDVVAAVGQGRLDPDVVDESAARVVRLLRRAAAAEPVAIDRRAHHLLAREAAARSIVLLKNDDAVLPLSAHETVAVIGRFAVHPRYQGGGSSHINAAELDVPLDEIRARAGGQVTFEEGADDTDAAVSSARAADVAVVFLGLWDEDESEGHDRTHIDLPAEQIRLLEAVRAVQPRTIAVLSHGGVVRLSEVNRCAAAILDGALLGQGGGAAIADVLFGITDPSGRLAETVPVRLQDVPSFLTFPGEHSQVRYGEGVFVGYRGYDARDIEVTFPFGHGLSYTDFRYSDLSAAVDDAGVTVSVTVSNIGDRSGREVVQVYLAFPESAVTRPPQELKAFDVVELESGADATVTMNIPRTELAHWDDRIEEWVVEGGRCCVRVGGSSRNIMCSTDIQVSGDPVQIPLTTDSTLGELLADPVVGPGLLQLFQAMAPGDGLGTDMLTMISSMPLSRLRAFGAGEAVAAVERILSAGAESPAESR